MTKFSKELRIEVLMEIKAGNSIRGTARKFGISRSVIQVWLRHYTAGGIEQAISSKKAYTQEFKLNAVEYRRAFGLSYPQAVADLGIANPSTLLTW
jgi:transposase-like protein